MLPRKYLPRLQNNVYERRAAHAAAQLFAGVPMALDYDQLLNKRPGKAGAIFAWHQDMASDRAGAGAGAGGGRDTACCAHTLVCARAHRALARCA
jgi:hypothetical protein